MREPYETLLGQYRDHWLLGSYLQGYEPDFAGLVGNDRISCLSSGELLMVRVALAFYNGDRTATLADLATLDDENRQRVTDALYIAMRAFR